MMWIEVLKLGVFLYFVLACEEDLLEACVWLVYTTAVRAGLFSLKGTGWGTVYFSCIDFSGARG